MGWKILGEHEIRRICKGRKTLLQFITCCFFFSFQCFKYSAEHLLLDLILDSMNTKLKEIIYLTYILLLCIQRNFTEKNSPLFVGVYLDDKC